MRGAATVYFLALIFVTQAGNTKKPKVPKSTEKWTSRSSVNAEELGEHFEGDIILPLPGLDRSGLLDEKYRWPDGRVPYEIDSGFSDYEVVSLHRAFQEYDEKTDSCIQFVEHENEKDYIVFQKFGTILHEMLHALGFFHEQSRTDRDDYVTVIWDNINDEFKGNFKKVREQYGWPFGVEYDYGSVMHYSEYAFSSGRNKTIVPTDSSARIGQRSGFSKKDVKKLMNMYQCKEKV